jgi:hypothetical protein
MALLEIVDRNVTPTGKVEQPNGCPHLLDPSQGTKSAS